MTTRKGARSGLSTKVQGESGRTGAHPAVRADGQSRNEGGSTSKPNVSESQPKSQELTLTWNDLPNMVDAIFDGDHDRPGWLQMFANANGRSHVDALFPEACVEWHRLPFPGFLDGWRGMQVNLAECVSRMATNLPLEAIPAGRTIDDCTPDGLATLLALGVRRDGGRAAILLLNNGVVRVEIFKPRDN